MNFQSSPDFDLRIVCLSLHPKGMEYYSLWFQPQVNHTQPNRLEETEYHRIIIFMFLRPVYSYSVPSGRNQLDYKTYG